MDTAQLAELATILSSIVVAAAALKKKPHRGLTALPLAVR
jgi:hypothetical protein